MPASQNELLQSAAGLFLGLWFVALGGFLVWSPRASVVLVLVAALGLVLLRPRDRFLPWQGAAFLPMVVVLISLIGIGSNTTDALYQAGQLLALAVPACLLLAVIKSLKPKDLDIALKGLLVGGGLLLSMLAVELLSGQAIYRLTRGLSSEAILDPNALNRPAVLAALLIWPIAGVLWVKGWKLLALALPLAYAVLTFWMTSASTSLGMAFGIVVFAVSFWGWRWVRWLLVIGGGLAFGLAVKAAFWMAEGGLQDVSWLEFSAKHRVVIWDYVANRIMEKPYFGWGLDSSRILNEVGGSLESRPAVDLLPLHPHNAMLQIWLELGGVGALIAVVFLVLVIGEVDQVAPSVRPFAAGLFATTFAISTTAFGVWQSWWLAGIVAASAAVLAVSASVRAARSQLAQDAFTDGSKVASTK